MFSWSGFANGVSFKEIDDAELASIEKFVQNEMLSRIMERCTMLGTHFDENEKEYFFGMYASSINEFKFVQGERLLIFYIADSLTHMFDTNGPAQFAKYFEVPVGFKINKADNCTFTYSVGLFYGKKPRKRVMQLVITEKNVKNELFLKVKQFFQSFGLKPVQEITEDDIKITDLGSGSARADIKCIFCTTVKDDISGQKRHAIQYDKTGRWNFSNLRKHMNIHKKIEHNSDDFNDEEKTDNTEPYKMKKSHEESEFIDLDDFDKSNVFSMPTVSNDSNIEEESKIIDESTNEESHTFDEKSTVTDTIKILYSQISTQNLILLESTLKNGGQKKFMSLMVGDCAMNIHVMKIKSDGDCLYAALSHQLENLKINSEEHKIRTMNLRQEVVSHILENLDFYKQSIKLRLESENEQLTFSCENSDEMCQEYLSKYLSKSGFWGGSETILAISIMFSTNIIIFNEESSFFLATGFNSKYKKVILLAYRIGSMNEDGSTNYNHYDSVCGIKEEIMFKCANILAEKLNSTIVCE